MQFLYLYDSNTIFFLVLPVLSEPPNILDVGSTTVTLNWTAWNAEMEEGDPPVVEYTVYVASSTTGSLTETLGTSETSMILNNLEPNTTYEFSVAAVREGEGGTGPASPKTNATTLPPGKLSL